LLILIHWRQKAAWIPSGRIIYSDTRSWGKSERVLFDPEIQLAGKPDYLVRQGSQIIPVEVKSSSIGQTPYAGHILQLAAYCRLVTTSFGTRPAYGILHYSNRTFMIDYTPKLEAELLKLVKNIQSHGESQEIARSHNHVGRCRSCGYRSVCDQKLN